MDLESARAVKQEIEAIFARRGEGSRRPRLSVGVAPAGRRNEFSVAVRAASEADLGPDDLAVIRKCAGGEVDLQFTGAITPLGSLPMAAVSAHLTMGASVSHHRGSAGTLGFFARRNSDGVIGLVSNNHVLALSDEGRKGDEILHPSPADGGSRPKDVIARLCGNYPLLRQSKPRVDCAFACLVPGISYEAESLGGGHLLTRETLAPEEAWEVSKIGRTTGLTHGRISAFQLNDVAVDYTAERLHFEGQIEIQSVDASPFGVSGDSGSLVFSEPDRRPVGLLFASSAMGKTYANPIAAVLSALDVSFA